MPSFQPYKQAAKECTWQRETTENKKAARYVLLARGS
jgi:hypothetical protein